MTNHPKPNLWQLSWTMLRLGLVSFGGNNALLMSELMVNRKGWLSQEDMDDAIAVATLGPGGNSSNLSYEVGRRLHGVSGGAVSYLSMALPGMVLVLLVGSFILSLQDNRFVAGALEGAEAAVVAMIIAIGIRLGKKSLKHAFDWVLVLFVFVSAGLLNLSLLLCLPPAIAIGYLAKSRGWVK